MKNLSVDLHYLLPSADSEAYRQQLSEARKALKTTVERTGPGNEYLGWLDLPEKMTAEVPAIEKAVTALKEKVDLLVTVGIGGSYLGGRAVIEALHTGFRKESPLIYAGHQLDEDYMHELLDYLSDKSFGIMVISKSGTTTEPAIAFRLLKKQLEEKVGREESAKRIIAITDPSGGALRNMANQQQYTSFVIPPDVGGRYSVLSPVGLLPIAAVGIDIGELLRGARDLRKVSLQEENNPVLQYAAARNLLYHQGKKMEILVHYNSRLFYLAEWWKQLFGESEGKDERGIFPVAVGNTTDLHSLGQYIQDGERTIFETVLHVEESEHKVFIPADENNMDTLNYLSGNRLGFVNHQAEKGTTIAHVDGGVSNILLSIPKISPYYVGQLIWFYELACAVSGYMLGVNPFDQPGVEAYKRNMFKLLGKPGA